MVFAQDKPESPIHPDNKEQRTPHKNQPTNRLKRTKRTETNETTLAKQRTPNKNQSTKQFDRET